MTENNPSGKRRAKVSAALLTRVDRFFHANAQTLVYELLQNARRAGATEVDVSITRIDDVERVTITDNGVGMDDKNLLYLANSDWEAPVPQEDPAGMGLFSLVGTKGDVTFSSRDWTATVPQAAFKGAADFEVTRTPGAYQPSGLTISYEYDAKDAFRDHAHVAAVKEMAVFFPLVVRLNGHQLPQLGMDGLFRHALDVTEMPELGVRVALFECKTLEHELKYFGMERLAQSTGSEGGVFLGNFYGQLIRWIEGTQKDNRPRASAFAYVVDVKEAHTVRLSHPDRKSFLITAGLDRLRHELFRMEYVYVAKQFKGNHAYTYERYIEARDTYNVDIGEAPPRYQAHVFDPEKTALEKESAPDSHTDEFETTDPDDKLLLEDEGDDAQQTMLWFLINHGQAFKFDYKFASIKHGYQGYTWAKKTPRALFASVVRLPAGTAPTQVDREEGAEPVVVENYVNVFDVHASEDDIKQWLDAGELCYLVLMADGTHWRSEPLDFVLVDYDTLLFRKGMTAARLKELGNAELPLYMAAQRGSRSDDDAEYRDGVDASFKRFSELTKTPLEHAAELLDDVIDRELVTDLEKSGVSAFYYDLSARKHLFVPAELRETIKRLIIDHEAKKTDGSSK